MNRFKVITVAVTLLALQAVPVVNRRIRASLAAPRLRETGVPDGLPWREVYIPTRRDKTLFGRFIPSGEAAPALAVVHGWGGNAEMMLPLAEPLHAAGYAALFFDARSQVRIIRVDLAQQVFRAVRPVVPERVKSLVAHLH